jgi:hypothetical protein
VAEGLYTKDSPENPEKEKEMGKGIRKDTIAWRKKCEEAIANQEAIKREVAEKSRKEKKRLNPEDDPRWPFGNAFQG